MSSGVPSRIAEMVKWNLRVTEHLQITLALHHQYLCRKETLREITEAPDHQNEHLEKT